MLLNLILAAELSDDYMNRQPIKLKRSKEEGQVYNDLKHIRNKFLSTDINELNPNEIIEAVQSLFYK